jgi:hypothetical protein
VQGTRSFVGFPSFYMQPDKTPRNVETPGPGRKAGDLNVMTRYGPLRNINSANVLSEPKDERQ